MWILYDTNGTDDVLLEADSAEYFSYSDECVGVTSELSDVFISFHYNNSLITNSMGQSLSEKLTGS